MISKKNFLLILSLCTTHYATAAHSFSSEFSSLRTVCIGGIAVAATGALAYNYFFKPLSGADLEKANEKALNTIYSKINEYSSTPHDYRNLFISFSDNDYTIPNGRSLDILYSNRLIMNIKATNLDVRTYFFDTIQSLLNNTMEEDFFISNIKKAFTATTLITVTFPK
jgi:hypothetical protein